MGTETNNQRRSISRLHHPEELHRRLPRLFSDRRSPTSEPDDSNSVQSTQDDGSDAERSPGFLGREHSLTSISSMNGYSRLMHTHTKSQMDSPGMGTIPTYAKTMHAHTLVQLREHRRASRSEANSPTLGSGMAMVPTKVCQELTRSRIDDVPAPPDNTPDHPFAKVETVVRSDLGKLRRRSLTTPYAARDFAVIAGRELAVSAANT